MANTYVSALWGNDSYNGLSAESGKATIGAGISAAGNEDTVTIYPGTYNESVNFHRRSIVNVGKIVLDGENDIDIGVYLGVNTTTECCYEIKNYISAGILISDINHDDPIEKFTIHDCGIGIHLDDGTSLNLPIRYNTIYNCTIGIQDTSQGGQILCTNNTIYNCVSGMRIDPTIFIGDLDVTIKDNIFSQNNVAIVVDDFDDGDIIITSWDYNLYNVPSGGYIGYEEDGSFYSTLAGWQTKTSDEANSANGDPQFANAEKGIFSILPGSTAESHSSTSKYVGARKTEIGWYNDALMQSGITLIDTSITSVAGQSGIVLNPTIASGTVELGVIDLGESKNIINFWDFANENYSNQIIDIDASDNSTVSGLIQVEFRTSATLSGISGASYSGYDLRVDPASGVLEDRFIQTRITLNG